MKVKPEWNDTPESLVRKFMKKVKKSGMLEDLFERKYYKKPSQVRKEKERARERVIQKLKQEKEDT